MTTIERAVTRPRIARTGRVSVEVAAPPAAVWQVVSDPTRTPQWSHECYDVTWRGTGELRPGARFWGRNRSARLRWTRTCEVTAVEPGRLLAWRTVSNALYPDATQWQIELTGTDTGTRIEQSFQVTVLPAWLERVLVRVNPSHIDRTEALREDLRRLGALALEESGHTEPVAD
ncbi:MAG: SRPBCC family protein [Actinomycetes bacterium]